MEIPAIRVNQWLDEWNKVNWEPENYRSQPERSFYLFSMKAKELRKLSQIYRRSTEAGRRQDDLGIQRRHDERRSKRISQYVKEGYPYCEIPQRLKESEEHESLRKPGWLPTGIVINILRPGDQRGSLGLHPDDAVHVEASSGSLCKVNFPSSFSGEGWAPKGVAPIEVIDGQHRLWAFDEDSEFDDFELPVIAFVGLDISWQAYIFWSINISPVKINKSLVFDMYPLLRSEDWVDKLEGHKVYKEARAQELVEVLWIHPESPWKGKINMLAESGNHYVRQATWARAIINGLMKNLNVRKHKGGLFGEVKNARKEVLPWTRQQQAAFLIYFGQRLAEAIYSSKASWVTSLRSLSNRSLDFLEDEVEPGMFGAKSLLSTDQGIRVLWSIVNDVCVGNIDEWGVFQWPASSFGIEDEDIDSAISQEISSLRNHPISGNLTHLARLMADFDWRTSSAPGLSDGEKQSKMAYRGSGGYSLLKKNCLAHIRGMASEELQSVIDMSLGLEE